MDKKFLTDEYFEALAQRKTYQRIVCHDGASVSVQAGVGVYCTPDDTNDGPFTHVEAGFPSVEPPASWHEYAGDTTNFCETIYARMPWDCVEEFINIHGGMMSGELPPAGAE